MPSDACSHASELFKIIAENLQILDIDTVKRLAEIALWIAERCQSESTTARMAAALPEIFGGRA